MRLRSSGGHARGGRRRGLWKGELCVDRVWPSARYVAIPRRSRAHPSWLCHVRLMLPLLSSPCMELEERSSRHGGEGRWNAQVRRPWLLFRWQPSEVHQGNRKRYYAISNIQECLVAREIRLGRQSFELLF